MLRPRITPRMIANKARVSPHPHLCGRLWPQGIFPFSETTMIPKHLIPPMRVAVCSVALSLFAAGPALGQPAAPAAPAAEPEDKTVLLTPFEVSASSDTGYAAT